MQKFETAKIKKGNGSHSKVCHQKKSIFTNSKTHSGISDYDNHKVEPLIDLIQISKQDIPRSD